MSIYEYDEERQRRFDREEGRLEGRLEDEKMKLVNLIHKKLAKGNSVTEIAEMLEETEEVIETLIQEYNL